MSQINKILIGIAAAAVVVGVAYQGFGGAKAKPAIAKADAVHCELDRPIRLGVYNWSSAQFTNALAEFILENGYGCQVEAVPGATMPITNAVGNGDVDILMELWVPNYVDLWNEFRDAGKVYEPAGISATNAEQGFYIPRFVVEGDPERGIEPIAPDLRTVADLAKYPQIFENPEDPTKGLFVNCQVGWSCSEINSRKLEAYGLTGTFTDLKTGTGAALFTAFESAYDRGVAVVGYGWTPSWIQGKLDLLKLEEPEYDKAIWDTFTAAEDATGMQATAYPTFDLRIATTADFAETAPEIITLLDNWHLESGLLNESLAYLQANENADEHDAAIRFLQQHEDVWTQWVPTDVKTRIQGALNTATE